MRSYTVLGSLYAGVSVLIMESFAVSKSDKILLASILAYTYATQNLRY